MLSAFLFGELWIFTASPSANLSIVDPGKAYERARLNERPIFFRTNMILLGIAQALYHVYADLNRINVPLPKVSAKQDTANPTPPAVTGPSIGRDLTSIKSHQIMFNKSIAFAMVMAFVGPFVYSVLNLRTFSWHLSLQWAELLWVSIPRNSRMSPTPPYIGDLLGRYAAAAFFLSYLWEFTNRAFSVGLAQPPIKLVNKEERVLSEGSNKPNATLISGLKAKRDVVRTNAFWELVIIASQLAARRISIFKDVDGTSSAWTEILTVSLAEFHAIVKRIQDFTGESTKLNPPVPSYEIPSRTTILRDPLRTNPNIFAASPPPKGLTDAVETQFSNLARAAGSHPGADTISPQARKAIAYTADKVLSPDQQAALTPTGLMRTFASYISLFLATPVGIPFRQTFARRATCVILGTPRANLSVLVDATQALAQLALHALKEDSYGLVFGDVATIIRTYTSTIEKIEKFLAEELAPHWTDVEFAARGRRPGRDVRLLLRVLKDSLAALMARFAEFSDELGLAAGEVRRARAASGA